MTNTDFLLHEYERLASSDNGLDYGCGAGHLLAAALGRGHDFCGVENYYGDPERWQPHVDAEIPDTARDRISLLEDQWRIPFPDASFGFVCSDQVLEHVDDIAVVAAEIARVTKTGGWGVHAFPVKERITEAHMGIPYYHRIPARFRPLYSRPWHRARVALYSKQIPGWSTWYEERNGFYEGQVRLRSTADIEEAFGEFFDVCPIEAAKLSFHLGRKIPENAAVRFLERRRVGAALLMQRR